MEPHRNKGYAMCAWKTSRAMVTIMSFMVMSLVFLLAWEGTQPLLLVFTPETKISSLSWYLGDRVHPKAIWASNEQDEFGVPRMVERRWRFTTNDQPGDSAGEKIQEEVSVGSTVPRDPREKAMVLSSSEETDFTQIAANISIHTTAPSDSAAKLGALSDSTTDEDSPDEKVGESKRTNNTTSSSSVCDFTRGYWVKDESRPLYDGRKCKGFLAAMWACREMKRPDFEYEKLRWQPDGCDLPTFTSHDFLERMRNKVIAFVGDSLGRQQFQSLMCMLTEGKDVKEEVVDAAEQWVSGPILRALRGKGYINRFTRTNTTVIFHWSATLNLLEYNRPDETNGSVALHLDQPDIFLTNEIQKLDFLILNSGHHWNRGKFDGNKWRMYVDGQRLVGNKLSGIGEAYNFSMYKVVEYLDDKLAETGGKPTVFMRTLSPRHFKNGEWNSGGTCDNTRPQLGQKVISYKGPTTQTVIENAVRGSKRVHLLNITPLSSSREEGHISKYGKNSGFQDCLHWCLPGVPDTWNELVYGYLAIDKSLAGPTSGNQTSKG